MKQETWELHYWRGNFPAHQVFATEQAALDAYHRQWRDLKNARIVKVTHEDVDVVPPTHTTKVWRGYYDGAPIYYAFDKKHFEYMRSVSYPKTVWYEGEVTLNLIK